MPRDIRTPVRGNTNTRRRRVRRVAPLPERRATPPSRANVRARRRIVAQRPRAVPGRGLQMRGGDQRRVYDRPTRVGRQIEVRTPGGVRRLSPAAYRRAVGLSGRNLAAREREARVQGFRSAGAQALANRAGRPVPHHFAVAGISGPSLKRFVSRKTLLGAVNTPSFRAGVKESAANTLHDVVSLPANTVVGAYQTGKALERAALHRDLKPAEALLKQLKETDPIALALQGRFREAAIQAGQHPVATTLEVYGTGATASRLGGRAVRRVSGGRVAGVAREPRRLPGTRLAEPRSYHPGLVGKRIQVGVERGKRARQRQLERKATVAEREGRPEAAQRLRAASGRINPDRMPERYIARRMDLQEGLHQSVRRPHRAETANAARQVLKAVPSRQRPLISLVAQHIARANPEDLRTFRKELAAEYDGLDTRAKRGANKKMRRQIDRALSSEKTDYGAIEAAAREYAAVQRPLEEHLVREGMLDAGEAEKAKLKPYAVRRMGARDVPELGLVRGRDVPAATEAVREIRAVRASRDLTPRDKAAQVAALEEQASRLVLRSPEIKAHMRDPEVGGGRVDPETAAFVTHAPRKGSGGAFNVSFREPRGIPKKRRTGEAVRQGLLDLNPERLVEQNVKMRGLTDATERFRGNLSQIAYRDHRGKVVTKKSRKAAQEVADDLMFDLDGEPLPGAHQWRVVRANPWHGREAQLRKTLERADDEGYMLRAPDEEGPKVGHPVNEAIEDALQGKGPEEGEWVVVPEAAAKQLEEHAAVYRGVSPVGLAVTQAFRSTVLPLSIPWITGNIFEGSLRTAVEGAGPRSRIAMQRTLREKQRTDRRGAEEFLHSIPGGHYGGAHEQQVHLSADRFQNSRVFGPVARGAEWIAHKPGPKQVFDGWHHYTDFVFSTMNAAIESQFTKAVAGKHLLERGLVPKAAGRPIPKFLMTPGMKRAVQDAVEQGAWNTRNTNELAAMGEGVRRAYGAYESHPPWMRKMLLNWTPFLPWTLNSIRFLTQVLPRDHPTLTALIAANHQLQEDWRNQHGLDYYSAPNPVPPFLQGSIPTKGGGHSRLPRYTPFGFASDPTGNLAGLLLPQISGAVAALSGNDWKGDRIREGGKPVTDPIKLLGYAGLSFTFGTIPGVSLYDRIHRKGVKKALNPFEPVPPRKTPGGGGPKTVRQEFEAHRKKSAGNSVRDDFEKFKQSQGR